MAKGTFLSRKKITTEKLEYQKNKQGTGKKIGVNLTDHPCPHELLKMMVEAQTTSVWPSA